MFCPNCGNNIADNATFCPKCGATVGQDAHAASPAPQPAAKKEPKPKKGIAFKVLSAIVGILLIRLLTIVLTKVVIPTITNQQPAAHQTQTASDLSGLYTDEEIAELEKQVMNRYGDAWALSDCQVETTDDQVQLSFTSAVRSTDASAPTLCTLFAQEYLTSESASNEADYVAGLEQQTGISGVTEHIALYYADGEVCGEGLFNDQGLMSYSLAYQS